MRIFFFSSGTRAESGVQAAGDSAEEEASVGADGLRLRHTGGTQDRARREPSDSEAHAMKPPPLHRSGTEDRARRESSVSQGDCNMNTPPPSATLMVSLNHKS